MTTQQAERTGSNVWRIAGWSVAALILLVPAVSMQFSEEVNWGPGDFLVIGALLLLVGGAIEIISRFTPMARGLKWVFSAVAIAMFLLIWAELAVGIFD